MHGEAGFTRTEVKTVERRASRCRQLSTQWCCRGNAGEDRPTRKMVRWDASILQVVTA